MKKQLLTLALFAIISLNAKAQSWSPLGVGVNYHVLAITSSGTSIYAGGYFTTAGGDSANHIAKWDGNKWFPLGTGTNDIVNALIEFNGEIYVGGDFSFAGGNTANHIAKWTGTAWANVGTSGMNGSVYAFVIFNNELYAGGLFTTADGATVNRVAKYNGTTWTSVGTGMNWNANDMVSAFVVFNNELYAGGNFSGSPGVVKWNGTAWVTVGTGITGDQTMTVSALAVYNNKLYGGGEFFIGGSSSGSAFIRLNGSTWNDVGTPEQGPVWALAVYNNELYIGGNISGIIGSNLINNIEKWNDVRFDVAGGTDDYILTLYSNANGLYAGGYFKYADGLSANSIAKWATPLGIDENILTDGLTIYPNPTSGIFNLKMGKVENVQIKICDMLGNTIYQNNSTWSTIQIDLSTQPNGIYLVQLKTEQGIINKKLIIQK